MEKCKNGVRQNGRAIKLADEAEACWRHQHIHYEGKFLIKIILTYKHFVVAHAIFRCSIWHDYRIYKSIKAKELMYRVGFLQFLDVVLHDYDKAKEQLTLL